MKKIHPSLIENMKKNLMEKYPCCVIPRKKIAEATGGILHPRTMANEDCSGEGIADPIVVKGNVCYGIDQILEYLLKNTAGTVSEDRVGQNSFHSLTKRRKNDE